MSREWQRGDYLISMDKGRLDLTVVHGFLSKAYWSEGAPIEVIQRSIERSLVFGLYKGDQQIGFARVVTDYATFAWLADAFVLETFRGQGLGKWLIEVIVTHPELQGFRRWMLATRDAHGLYQRFGFTPLKNPERFMEKWSPDIYKQRNNGRC